MTKRPPKSALKPNLTTPNRFAPLADVANDDDDTTSLKKSVTWDLRSDKADDVLTTLSNDGKPPNDPPDSPLDENHTAAQWIVVKPRRKWPAPQLTISNVNSSRLLRPSIVHATDQKKFPRYFLEKQAMKKRKELENCLSALNSNSRTKL